MGTSPTLACLMLALLALQNAVPARAYDFKCNLFCYNGGECRHGKGKFGNYAGIGDDEVMPWEKVTTQTGMYCSCPVGYTGLQCEIKVVVCGDELDSGTTTIDEHTCFNGSACQKATSGSGKVYWQCECDPENSIMTSSYAGKYCEHISTVFCGRKGVGGDPNFCTNGGKCKEKETPDQEFIGCICPDGWEGAHCQFPVNTAGSGNFYSLNNLMSKESVTRIVLVVVISVLGFLWCCYYRDHRKKRSEMLKRRGGVDDGGASRSSRSYRRSYTKRARKKDKNGEHSEELHMIIRSDEGVV